MSTPSPFRVAARHVATSLVPVHVDSLREIVEMIAEEARQEFRVRKSTITDIPKSQNRGQEGGANLAMILDAPLEHVVEWVQEQASYDYSGHSAGFTVYDGTRKVRL